MKLLLKIYKITISPALKVLFGGGCRYESEGKMSCSEYATYVIEKYGIIKGVPKAFKRFLSCR